MEEFVCEALCYGPDNDYEDPYTYAVGLQYEGRIVFLAELPVVERAIQLLLPFDGLLSEEKPGWEINKLVNDLYVGGNWEQKLERLYEYNC